jgi:hypothetical protein
MTDSAATTYHLALPQEQVDTLHQEADILLNHVLNQELDLVRDLGCIIGMYRRYILSSFYYF